MGLFYVPSVPLTVFQEIRGLTCAGLQAAEQSASGKWMPRVKTLLFLVVLIGMAGCVTVPPLPPANLQEPGWTVRQGQAVWHMSRKRGGREVAGEFLLATRPDGRVFVQFSKSPFTLLTAQTTAHTWEIEDPTQNKRYSGHGQPPKAAIWLWLPRVLSGQRPPKGFSWEQLGDGGWRLKNNSTGESLEGYLQS